MITPETTPPSIPTNLATAPSLSPDEIARRRARGEFISDGTPAFDKPTPGFQIIYNGYRYGLNVDGGTRIDLSIPVYAWVLAVRSLSVKIVTPQETLFNQAIEISGLGTGSIFFRGATAGGLGSSDRRIFEGGMRSYAFSVPGSFISEAQAAAPVTGRLYIQSITVPDIVGANNVVATLSVGGRVTPTQTLSDSGAQADTSILVKGGAATVQSYRVFFPLPEPRLQAGATIKLQSLSGIWSRGYSDTFAFPADVSIGTPVELQGSAGGKLVVQLAYGVDVVFFERRDTPAITEALSAKLASMGFAPRVNVNSASIGGSYNVVYAGQDVPTSALQTVLRVLVEGGVQLRSVQPNIALSSGIQTQIQIGGSRKVACLPVIERPRLAAMTTAQSDSQFQAMIDALPTAGC